MDKQKIKPTRVYDVSFQIFTIAPSIWNCVCEQCLITVLFCWSSVAYCANDALKCLYILYAKKRVYI